MTNTSHVTRHEKSIDEHHDNLTPEQMLRVYSLSKIGYSLYFVREISDNESVAVVRCGKEIAAVNHFGEVDFKTKLALRK
jgi:hypothetical protein